MNQRISVLGGTGFVGSTIVRQLSANGYAVSVLTRNLKKGQHLASLQKTNLIECKELSDDVLSQALKDADAVINLIGILHEDRDYTFSAIHSELPKRLAEVCAKLEIKRLVHMSALQAAENAPSAYLRSKAIGEKHVLAKAQYLNVTIFRPSVIFGPGDNFINLFSRLIKVLPIIFLAKPDAKFQPVYVDDVATAFVESIDKEETFGKCYELGGPQVYTLRQLVELIVKVLGKKRIILGLNDSMSYLQALIMELLPIKLMTRDNLRSMQVDSVCLSEAPICLVKQLTSLESYLDLHFQNK